MLYHPIKAKDEQCLTTLLEGDQVMTLLETRKHLISQDDMKVVMARDHTQNVTVQQEVQTVEVYMLVSIYAQGQSTYISVFSLILFLYYFHFTVRTPFQFFPNFSLFFLPFYSLQKPVILTRHC